MTFVPANLQACKTCAAHFTASLNVHRPSCVCSSLSLYLSPLAYSKVLTEVRIHSLSVKALTGAR